MRTAVIVVEASLIGWLLLRRATGRRARRLLERAPFDAFLSALATDLAEAPAGDLDGALERGVHAVAVFLGADRASLDGEAGGHEVARPLSCRAPAVERWPFTARSHISIPLHVGERALGALSLSVPADRPCSDDELEHLRRVGQVFAIALERRRLELALVEHLRFERLLSWLAARFSALSAADFDREAHDALRQVADFLGFERAAVIEFTRDGTPATSSAGTPWIDLARLPWMTRRLQRGHLVSVSAPEDLPDSAGVDRLGYLALGIKPHLAVPLVAAGAVVGALVLGGPGKWARSAQLTPQLRLLCEIFASALARKQGEVEAQRLRQDLAHIGRTSAMGELTASLAHELNQPLTAILSNAQAAQQLLAAGDVDLDAIREILADIVADDKRAGGVIGRLRSVLRKGTLEFAPLDLNEIAREVAWVVRRDTAGRNVTMRLELATDVLPVRGDRGQLQQVVLNLVLNGLDAMRDAPAGDRTLVVRTARDGVAAARLAVQDSGIGIDEANMEQLFQPLHTTKPEGLGMGLAIARTIVEAHGGRLRAARNADVGATFHFTVPLDVAEPA
ncbi:MAG TPA: ATP-binding protein [Candidatus Tectomicrobia bacterium]|nr:ATP-binding protein [Candidatus Tectomicrobia bacterium]